MSEIDPSHILFPSDAPKQAPDWYQVAQNKPTAAPAPASPAADPQEEPDPSKLFPSEVASDDRDEAIEQLDVLANAVRMDGDEERAAALTEAGDVLLAEARAHGMPTADLREIVDQVHAAAGTVAPLSAEQIADLNAKAMREIEDIPAADLDLGRRLIAQMSKKMPGLTYQLDASGLGSDPTFIRSVVREAKRRAGR